MMFDNINMRLVFVFFLIGLTTTWAQKLSISGRVQDSNGESISLATILIMRPDGASHFAGTATGDNGYFELTNLAVGTYQLTVSMIGFEDQQMDIELTSNTDLGVLVLVEDSESLDETIINASKPKVVREDGKLIFKVENTAIASGNLGNLLNKTPGVVVMEEIKIKNTTALVYINNRRVFLSPAQTLEYLNSMDASIVKEIEVITNPSAAYDAEGNSILNIVTTKAIPTGYKASVNGSYELGTKPKYLLGTSQFFKNKWLDLNINYTANKRLEYKTQDDRIQFFNRGVKSDIWTTDFSRETDQLSHLATILADIKLGKKQTLNLSSNLYLLPERSYENAAETVITNAAGVVDSTFNMRSDLINDQHNLNFRVGYELQLDETGENITTSGTYINYNQNQDQDVMTNYFLSDGSFIRSNAFNTESTQQTDILIGDLNYSKPISSGLLSAGVKYSRIETDSGLDYFLNNNGSELVPELSDSFLYSESIYAAFTNLSKRWEKWSLQLGLRAEFTDVAGDSRSLGVVNTQEYLEWFPNVNVEHDLANGDGIGFSFVRRINRPRYQSLNPFRYFLNDFNFNGGDPNLSPGINSRFTFSYRIGKKLFFDLYYEKQKNSLSILTFQNNENRSIRHLNTNLIEDFQYSLDMVYSESIAPWWYISTYSSLFYLQNEFFAIESNRERYQNKTWGFYNQVYSSFKISKDRTFSADVSSVYFSNYIYGSYQMGERYSLSVSLRKSFWNNQANIVLGVDDIFNSYNINITSIYYNQDNAYFPKPESRLFRFTFKYNFGNTRLSNNLNKTTPKEAERLD